MKTLSQPIDELGLSCLRIAIDLEGETGLDAAEHAKKTVLDAVSASHFEGYLLFIRLAGREVDEGSGTPLHCE